MQEAKSTSNGKWLGATLLSAFLASLCCITPVLALIAGASGLAASFSWIDPYRPFLIGITLAVLTFAWYQKLRPQKSNNACACDEHDVKPFLQSKAFLGIVTGLSLLLLTFPSYSYIFFPEPLKANVAAERAVLRKARLTIQGMTCTGCEQHVMHTALQLEGVQKAEVSYEEGAAIIYYKEEKVKAEAISAAIERETGYEVIDYQTTE